MFETILNTNESIAQLTFSNYFEKKSVTVFIPILKRERTLSVFIP